MLVLTRKASEGVNGYVSIDDLKSLLKKAEKGEVIKFRVINVEGGKTRLGFDFPSEFDLLRDEVDPNHPKETS